VTSGEAGWITNLQDFVLHDGPGLRVLLFLRGCPLRCRWCQNPESLDLLPEIEFQPSHCLGCRRCLDTCRVAGAILSEKERRIDRSKCTRCMACAEACIGRAIQKVGEKISVEQMLRIVMRYKPFFDHSDRGGITLSGGEPIFQPEFTSRLLTACRKAGIHTVMETCGYGDYATLKKIVGNVNVLIYDIKHMDEAKHVEGTGKTNRLILRNLQRLCAESDVEIIVHMPLIRDFNDDENNVQETAKFVASLKKIRQIDLLPFNELAAEKYRAIGMNWECAGMQRQDPEQLSRLTEIVKSHGLQVTVGGLW